jgi:hypothetical protein
MRILKLYILVMHQLKSFVSVNDLDDPICLDELSATRRNTVWFTNSRQKTINPGLFQVLMAT